MREIKFKRAHFLGEEKKQLHHIDDWGIYPGCFKNPSSNNMALYFTDLQYTGLKDKNGKEIYEGDIINAIDNPTLADSATPGAVYWKDSMFKITWSMIPLGEFKESALEIIGNVFENPELLKDN